MTTLAPLIAMHGAITASVDDEDDIGRPQKIDLTKDLDCEIDNHCGAYGEINGHWTKGRCCWNTGRNDRNGEATLDYSTSNATWYWGGNPADVSKDADGFDVETMRGMHP